MFLSKQKLVPARDYGSFSVMCIPLLKFFFFSFLYVGGNSLSSLHPSHVFKYLTLVELSFRALFFLFFLFIMVGRLSFIFLVLPGKARFLFRYSTKL